MRVCVYVDGFNLYYRAVRRTRFRWLNLLHLAQSLLDPADHIDRLRYFTARVSPRAGNPSAPRDQQMYLAALDSLPQVTLHFGRFLPKDKWRPIAHPTWAPPVMVQIRDTEEKRSDVNLAVHMLNDALTNAYDAALLFSQDTDLCESMKLVRDAGKLVGLVCLDQKEPNRRLASYASFVRHVTPARLAAAQFPDVIRLPSGKRISRPADW